MLSAPLTAAQTAVARPFSDTLPRSDHRIPQDAARREQADRGVHKMAHDPQRWLDAALSARRSRHRPDW